MNLDRISLIIFLTVLIAAGTVCAADLPVSAVELAKAKADVEAASKLRFVKTTLLNGPTVQDRLDAAVALLERSSSSPPMTSAMFDVLQQHDRVDAKAACKQLGMELTPLDDTLAAYVGPEAS